MNWEDTKQAANDSILSAFSVTVSFIINGTVTVSSGAFTEPVDIPSYSKSRADDYELGGADARRSEYELEMLNENLPPSVCTGACVEIKEKVYTISYIDPPNAGTTVLHLLDSGEVT